MKGLKSLFLPTLYIIYAPSTYEDTISRSRILPLNTASKIKIRKGAKGAVIST